MGVVAIEQPRPYAFLTKDALLSGGMGRTLFSLDLLPSFDF